ncbi:CHAT domain-containing protein [Methylomicrobium sp. RS1]|uniref:CHAT domain-containing protein n=1 Tax=Candidatus Methylomicrobium oryzae TaxID=2802053 RepID=UPI0019233680|nr:CHAT domain-containing protein [Methylomicrobium sp. RS1]MBL1263510.1 CHAT domain-containing protein [Methylomicrobium sp. RS1]
MTAPPQPTEPGLTEQIEQLTRHIESLPEVPPEHRDWAGLNAAWEWTSAGMSYQKLLNFLNAGVAQIHRAEPGAAHKALALYRQGLYYVPRFIKDHPHHIGIREMALGLFCNAGVAQTQLAEPNAQQKALDLYFLKGLELASSFIQDHPHHAGIQEWTLRLFFNAGLSQSRLAEPEAAQKALALYRQGLENVPKFLHDHSHHAGMQELVLRLFLSAGTVHIHLTEPDAAQEAFALLRQGLENVPAFLQDNPHHAGVQTQILKLHLNASIAQSGLTEPDAAQKAFALLRQGLENVPAFLLDNPHHGGIQQGALELFYNAGITQSKLAEPEATQKALALYWQGLNCGAEFLKLSPPTANITLLLLPLTINYFNLFPRPISTWQSVFRCYALTSINPQLPFQDNGTKAYSNLNKDHQYCLNEGRIHDASLATLFQQELLDWLLDWRLVDDTVGLNGNLLHCCRAVEALWLLAHAEENAPLHAWLASVEKRVDRLQSQLDAGQAQAAREENLIRNRLAQARQRLGLAPESSLDAWTQRLAGRKGWWQRGRDVRVRNTLREWQALQNRSAQSLRLAEKDGLDVKRVRDAGIGWLAKSIIRFHHWSDGLSQESTLLLANVLAGSLNEATPHPGLWRDPYAIHRLMAQNGWVHWLQDDGTRPTLASWLVPGLRLQDISPQLLKSQGPAMDGWLKRYAAELLTYLETHPDFEQNLPEGYVPAVRRHVELLKARSPLKFAASPTSMDSMEERDLADVLNRAWLEAERTALELAHVLAAVACGGELGPLQATPDSFIEAKLGEEAAPYYAAALRAVIQGRIQDLLVEHIGAWLQHQEPDTDQTTLGTALETFKRQCTRLLNRHPGPRDDDDLTQRLHHYCRNLLGVILKQPQPDLDKLWETLERSRIALSGMQVRPLSPARHEFIGKQIFDEFRTTPFQPGRDCFTPLLKAWLAGLNAPLYEEQEVKSETGAIRVDRKLKEPPWLPAKPSAEDCRAKLRPGEALAQCFLDPGDGLVHVLWLDHGGLSLRELEVVSHATDENGRGAKADSIAPLLHAWRRWRQDYGGAPEPFEELWQRLEDHAVPRRLLAHWLAWAQQAEVSHLILLLDGELAQLPWEALLGEWFPGSALTFERAVSLSCWRTTETTFGPAAGGSVLFGDDRHTEADPILHREAEARQAGAYLEHGLGLKPVACRDAAELTTVEALIHLKRSRAAHFIGHGRYHFADPRGSALTLYRDNLREENLRCWLLGALPQNQRFLALTACESALCGFSSAALLAPVGIGQTLIAAGTRQVLGTLWKVNQDASWLFHHFLYEAARDTKARNWQELIAIAQERLQNLTDEEAIALIPETKGQSFAHNRINNHVISSDDGEILPSRPFRHPFYWAPFVVLGAPELP